MANRGGGGNRSRLIREIVSDELVKRHRGGQRGFNPNSAPNQQTVRSESHARNPRSWNLAPSTWFESPPNHRSRIVAYTERKSVVKTILPALSRSSGAS